MESPLDYKTKVRLLAEKDQLWAILAKKRTKIAEMCLGQTSILSQKLITKECIRVVYIELLLNKDIFVEKGVPVIEISLEPSDKHLIMKMIYLMKIIKKIVLKDIPQEYKEQGIMNIRKVIWCTVFYQREYIKSLLERNIDLLNVQEFLLALKCVGTVYLDLFLQNIEKIMFEEACPVPDIN